MLNRLLIHFPTRGHIYQLFQDGTVMRDGEDFAKLEWVPERDTFLAMACLWNNEKTNLSSVIRGGMEMDGVGKRERITA